MNEALNPRQDQFVDEYLLDGNGTQAAIKAGYSSDTAAQQASRLLRNVKVQQAIAARQRQLAEKRQWDRERVVAEAEENLAGAREAKQFGSANGALELIGRVTGLLDPKHQEPQAAITRINIIMPPGAEPPAGQIVESSYRELPRPSRELAEGTPDL